jgi:hypothetical protein
VEVPILERLRGPARGWIIASWSLSAIFFILLAYNYFVLRSLFPPRWLTVILALDLVAGAASQLMVFRQEHESKSNALRL